MDLSMKWLSDFVKSEVPVKKYSADMTMSGSKVEGYKTEGTDIKNVVVGKVISVEKHPNADSLFICKVDTGSAAPAPVQIVTGATNVVAGALVPVALDNSLLPGGKSIKKGKLRGEVSEGMLCSLSELGLTKGDFPYAIEDGIFLLEEDCSPGQDIQSAIGLDDTVVEFEITSNRPDCLSVIGLAREASATFNVPLTLPTPSVKAGGGDINELLSVTVENPALCPRYAAAAVKDVKIGPSPRWLRERLRASGVRPINNIVDITNYVMLEYGQPMHAFDLKNVKGSKIVVRNAKPGESIITLDGTERRLSLEMLVIADESSPSAVAGVMGGEGSGIYDDTNTVIFESACFDGASVRLTSKKLGLRTESSGRFEKGLDPANCLQGLMRACELVELLGAGTVCDGIIDVDNSDKTPYTMPLEADWINKLLGTEIPEAEMASILHRLGFTVDGDKITVPSFRADVRGKADIAEEIARIYGYNNIPSTAIRGVAQARPTPVQRFERGVADILLSDGFDEIVTYSFISPKYYDKINLPAESPLRSCVTIQNPLGEDTGVMRTTAIPSMLEALSRNYNNRIPKASLYEIATEYIPLKDGELPSEQKQVMLGQYGENTSFYTIKGAVETLLGYSGIREWSLVAVTDDPVFHPGRCARLLINGEDCGTFGEIHPLVDENYDIATRVYLARLDLEKLLKNANTEKQYVPLPRFPASTRDLALVCDESVPAGSMESAIKGAIGNILERIDLFDVYRGAQVGEGKKSIAYSLALRSREATLTDEECDRAVKRALKALNAIGVKLRGE